MPNNKKMSAADKKAEQMLKDKLKKKKVKDITKARDKIAKKTGSYPFGGAR